MALSDLSVPVPPVAPPAPAAPEPRLRRMTFGLLMVYVAILAVNSGGNGILLPNIVAGLDEAGKVGNLAIVTTVAFIANVFAQPIAGAFSDATRSRFGRRTPWMVGGALLASGFLARPADGAVGARRGRWSGWSCRSASTPCRRRRPRSSPTATPRPAAAGCPAMIGVGITIGNAVGAIVAGSTAAQGVPPVRRPRRRSWSWSSGSSCVVNRDESERPPAAASAPTARELPPRLLGQPAPAPRLRLGVRRRAS